MASRLKGGGDYSAKQQKEGGEEVPVASCSGWTEACDFCEKRFSAFGELDEETLDKLPQKPGLLQIALRTNKGITEVVDIVLHPADLQKASEPRLEAAKDRVADKKSKFTKAAIMCRWMTFQLTKDKDVNSLCAHWANLGVLPKFLPKWDSLLEVLRANSHYEFSERLQKWCHPKRDAYWKKPKTTPTKSVEVIEPCDWTKAACETCDTSFAKWRPIEEVVLEELAPEGPGVYMASVLHGKQREVVYLAFDRVNIKMNIRLSIRNNQKFLGSVLKNKKFANRSASLQVRWMELKDVDTENSCFLFAHWLNSGSLPLLNAELPGEKALDRSKCFVLSTNDKKWCYEVDTFRQAKITKAKNRKQLMDDLVEDLVDANVQEGS